MKENLIKKERNVKETIALVTGMFANIQDSLKDDRVRYRIFEDAYDARKVLYFQMLEKSEFVNYKVVEIQDKDIITFKLFLQTFGDDKLICEHTITDKYKLSIKHQTDINLSKETDIKSKEDKKEYPEHILKLLEMFRKIDKDFMLGYFDRNEVYPLLEKSIGEFLNLCNSISVIITPSVIIPNNEAHNLVLDFQMLVRKSRACYYEDMILPKSLKSSNDYIYILRYIVIVEFCELVSDIEKWFNSHVSTVLYTDLIDYMLKYIVTQIDTSIISHSNIKELRGKCDKLNNLFKVIKQAATQMDINIDESIGERLKEFCNKVDSLNTVSKEDKKEYPEHILKLLEMFRKIDKDFMLGYFDRNEVYPLLEKSIGEFLNLCDNVQRQLTPICPTEAVKIGPDKITLLSDFHRLVSIVLEDYNKKISEASSQSSESFTDYVHLLRYTVATKHPELSNGIRKDLNIYTIPYRNLLDFVVDYMVKEVDTTLLSCKDAKELREKYDKLSILFTITKQAATQMGLDIVGGIDEKLKTLCDHIDKKSETMTLLLEKFIEIIRHFNLNISDGKIKAEMDKSDDNFIEYTLKIFSDNMRKVQEDPNKDTFRKDMDMLMSLGNCIVVANHENNKITGFTTDIPVPLFSIRNDEQENKPKESKEDTKKKVEKDIFAPIDWEKELEKSSKELLKSAYCCKELKPTSLYPSYVTIVSNRNYHDEHLSILKPLDAKMSATKVIAHIVAHMNNAPISKDTIVESFVDQFGNINVNIYDNSGETPKTLVTRTYAHDEYTVTELGCGYAVGIYSTKYNKNEAKDYYIPYKKKC